MPYAITLRLNDSAAAHVVALWRRLADTGVSRQALDLGYAPHVTLGIWPDTAAEAALRDAVAGLAARHRALTVSFPSAGMFPGNPTVLFLAPVVTAGLVAIQHSVFDILRDQPTERFYQPGQWVPHLTLADDLVDAAPAVAALCLPQAPISGVLDRIDLVHFRPVDIRASLPLQP